MPIDAKVEAEKLRQMYKDDPRQKLATILLTGESGSGKTYGLQKCPRPIHIDSFDPGGSKGIKKAIGEGHVIVDTAYEDEDPMKPTAYAKWKGTFEKRLDGGYFESIGTYCLDSATTWTDAIMNHIQKKRGGAGSVPEWNKDYHPQKVRIKNRMRQFMTLPCHFVLTAHLEPQKDKEGNVTAWRVMFSGKGAITIPLLFDEIWVADSKEKREGYDYFIHTQRSGLFLARSRLAAEGRLEPKEPNNLMQIFKKAGLTYTDKEALLGKATD